MLINLYNLFFNMKVETKREEIKTATLKLISTITPYFNEGVLYCLGEAGKERFYDCEVSAELLDGFYMLFENKKPRPFGIAKEEGEVHSRLQKKVDEALEHIREWEKNPARDVAYYYECRVCEETMTSSGPDEKGVYCEQCGTEFEFSRRIRVSR